MREDMVGWGGSRHVGIWGDQDLGGWVRPVRRPQENEPATSGRGGSFSGAYRAWIRAMSPYLVRRCLCSAVAAWVQIGQGGPTSNTNNKTNKRCGKGSSSPLDVFLREFRLKIPLLRMIGFRFIFNALDHTALCSRARSQRGVARWWIMGHRAAVLVGRWGGPNGAPKERKGRGADRIETPLCVDISANVSGCTARGWTRSHSAGPNLRDALIRSGVRLQRLFTVSNNGFRRRPAGARPST